MILKPNTRFVTGLMGLVFFVTSCQKKEETSPQPSKVTIELISPKAGQVFHKGDTIQINANVSYISQLHGFELSIKDKETGTLVYSTEGHVHSDHFTIAEKWVSDQAKTSTLKLEVNVEIDHDGNEAKQEVEIKNQP